MASHFRREKLERLIRKIEEYARKSRKDFQYFTEMSQLRASDFMRGNLYAYGEILRLIADEFDMSRDELGIDWSLFED